MANPTVDLPVSATKTNLRWNLPVWLVAICVVTFSVLLGAGAAIWKNAPPIPATIVSPQQEIVLTQAEIQSGQETYLARGGQHIGSIWGHGSYLAPDWTADFLHRWGLATAGVIKNNNPNFAQTDLEALPAPERASLQARIKEQFKTNRYDAQSQALVLTNAQTQGIKQAFKEYQELLAHGSRVHSIPDGWFKDDTQIHNVTAFFAWTAWTAAANRPNAPFSYTANWPHDGLIGNQPPAQFLIWSIVSVIVLIGAIAVFLFIYLRAEAKDDSVLDLTQIPAIRKTTASQKITSLFFLVAMVLFLIQIGAGMVTAHYAVEGDSFYGLPIQQFLPYAASRTWHLQLAVFWIATCWLAAGLYFAPRFGREPKKQGIANLGLLIALAIVVAGAMVGSWASIQGILGNQSSFWWGHQGYEYVELGRVWQLLLIGGMVFWLWLMYRALKPALEQEGSRTGLNHFFFYSAVTIPLFHSAGLMYTNHTPLSIAEYWRWWVVHLWVEGFFEVFATVTIAYLCSELGFLWLRMPGDILFSVGAVALFGFTLRAVITIFRSPKLAIESSLSFKNR